MKNLMKFFRHFVHVFMVKILPASLRPKSASCEKFAHHIARFDDNSSFKRLQVRIHTMMCESCHNYHEQLKIINQGAHKLHEVKLDKEQLESIKKSKDDLISRFQA